MSDPLHAHAVTSFVVAHIAKVRKRDPATIDPDLPFNELGVDSLDAVTLVGEVERCFALTIDPAELFDHPTPREFASMIATRSARHVL